MADRPRAERRGKVWRAGRVRLRPDAVEPRRPRHPRPRRERAAAAGDGQPGGSARLRAPRRHHAEHERRGPAHDGCRAERDPRRMLRPNSAAGDACGIARLLEAPASTTASAKGPARRLSDRLGGPPIVGWLGLRFAEATASVQPQSDGWRSLLELASALASTYVCFYGILTDPVTGLPGRAELQRNAARGARTRADERAAVLAAVLQARALDRCQRAARTAHRGRRGA